MFILIILRDVSFLLSGKGNKVTESPATTIIHRVYESPCGIITTYATPWTTLALNNTHTSTLSLSCPLSPSPTSPTHPISDGETHLRELGVAWGITARSGKSPPNGQVAPSLSLALSLSTSTWLYLHIKRVEAPNWIARRWRRCEGTWRREKGGGRWGKGVAFGFLCLPAPKSMLRN